MGGTLALILFFFKNIIFNLFTNKAAVIAQLSAVWPFILAYTFFDSPQFAASAGLRAAG